MDRNQSTSVSENKCGFALLAATVLLSACQSPAERQPQREPILSTGAKNDPDTANAHFHVGELTAQGPINKEQLFALALRQSTGLDAIEERALASQEAALASGAMPEPKVSWTEFFDEVETRVGPQDRRFEVSQALPWFGALESDIRSAEASARAASTSVHMGERALLARIDTLLWRGALYRQTAQLEESRIALFESISSTIDGRYRTGNAEYADLLRSRSEIERAIERKDAALDQVNKTEVQLRRELGLVRGAPLPEVTLHASPEGALAFDTKRINGDLGNSPTLIRLGHLAEAAKERQERVAFDRKPELTVGAFLVDTGLADNPATSGSGQNASGIKISFTLPIRTDKYDAQERSARHQVRALRKERLDQLLALEGQVSLALEDLAAANRRRTLITSSLLPRAQEILDTTRAGYSSGRATYQDLVSAGNSQIGLEIELVRAEVEREFARITIETHLGRSTASLDALAPSSTLEN